MQTHMSALTTTTHLRTLAVAALAVTFSVLMLAARIWETERITYFFLVWNLFLAGVPLALALFAELLDRRRYGRPFAAALLIAWLAFLPNAPYIITDLLHLRARENIPLWYDVLLLFSFAGTGLWLGLVSLRITHALMEQWLGRIAGWLFVGASVALCGVGVYIGRILRFNSWDLLHGADRVVVQTWQSAQEPRAAAMMLLMAGLVFCAYMMMRHAPQIDTVPQDRC